MIKLTKSTFFNEEETKKELCNFIFKSEKLSMGKMCKNFEESFAEYQDRKYAVFFNSGSSANIALIASLIELGLIKKNSKMGFSGVTWATNVMPIIQLGLEAIPIDVSLENLNITSETLMERINETKIDSLFITNVLGLCGDIDKIKKICDEKKIILIEDNCEALGSEINNKKLGNFGIASTFSFFVGHHLSTIEGGMVCTDNKELYNLLIMVRAHGWDRDLASENQNLLRKVNEIEEFYSLYTFYVNGYNFRPTEINGFLGLEQIKNIPRIIQKRFDNFLKYEMAKKGNSDINKINFNHMNLVSNFAYPIICKDKSTTEYYKQEFKKNKIEIRPIVGGSIIEQPFFKSYKNGKNIEFDCPNSKIIHENGFYIPNNPELEENEIKLICEVIMNKEKEILVTGASGMVGQALVTRLKEIGYKKILTPTSKELDLRKQEDVKNYFKKNKIDYVYHIAATVGGINANIESPAKFLYDNLSMNNNIIHFSMEYNIKKLLFLGSSCIYPKECKQPMKEEYLGTGELEPTNEGYAIAKIAGLKQCEYYNKQYNTNFISLMPCNLYGKNDNFDSDKSHVMAALIKKFHEGKKNNSPSVEIWGTGESKREFLHVDDLVDAIIYFMEKYDFKEIGSFINIGSGEDISIKKLANLIKEIIGYEGKITFNTAKPDGMKQKLLDVSKAKKMGWEGKINLKDGIIMTYNTLKKN